MIKPSTLKMLLFRIMYLVALITVANLMTVPATAQEEARIEIPATQFDPIGETIVIPQLQIYPVLIIHDRPVSDAPLMYMSIYFRDCSKRYSKAEIISMVVQTAEPATKITFHIKHQENEGAFQSPFEGMDESMLNEEGKKLLNTKQTYYVAEPEIGRTQNEIAPKLKNAKDLLLLLDLKLYGNETPVKSIQHTFTLRGKKLNDTIIRYANGESPINQTITIPELPSSCFKK